MKKFSNECIVFYIALGSFLPKGDGDDDKILEIFRDFFHQHLLTY